MSEILTNWNLWQREGNSDDVHGGHNKKNSDYMVVVLVVETFKSENKSVQELVHTSAHAFHTNVIIVSYSTSQQQG